MSGIRARPEVFILEPQSIFVLDLAQTIARCGGRVTRVADSLENFDVRSLQTDVAVLDLDYTTLGVVNGLSFFRDSAPPNVHLVVVTGEHEPGLLHRCRTAGACAVISKSSTARELAVAFRRILGGAMYYDPRIDAA